MKTIVISGGTRGIGRAIAEKFAKEGFTIIISARNERDLRNTQLFLEKTYAIKCHIFQADMAIRAEVLAWVSFIQNVAPKVDILVNNAGFYASSQIHTESIGTIEKFIESNVYSAYYLTNGLIHSMKEHRHGHIFNICSIASLQPYSHSGSYTISKYALLGFSKTLREEMKPFGVRVTSIMPGAVLTDSWTGTELPAERFIKASDVADTIWATYQLSESTVIEEIVIRPQIGDI